MNIDSDCKLYTDAKKLPKEYLLLQYRINLNKELLEEKLISYEIFSKMQNMLIKKMDKIILENTD